MEVLVRKISGVAVDEFGNLVPKQYVKRDIWPHHLDFVLGCIGYAVGFGSIWRFPYLCMRNGGGAFLIPYVFFTIICGIPLFFMELALGQFAAASPLSLWNICPLFKGLGWSMLIVSGLVSIYYNIILTWVLYYMFSSLGADVPWRTCGNWWNTNNCMELLNPTRNNSIDINSNVSPTMNLISSNITLKTSPAEEFWKFNALGISEGIHQLEGVHWPLFFCLAFAWLLLFACLCKGVKSVGKVVYFTATSPYVFLTILLIRNCFLKGSLKGILFYLKPRWERLNDFSIWAEAALQVFFSLGPAWGGLITLSSYNKFKNNCYRDALIIPAANCFTSLFGGLVIFSVIGYMAEINGLEVEQVMEVGPGVTFVAYPEAIAHMPFPSIWAVMFFFMLLTIGLDSQFGLFETVISSFVDEFPVYLRPHKLQFTGIVCFLWFLLAIPLVTKGGIYVFTIMDWYCGTFSLVLIAFLEVVVVCYIYGIRRFMGDITAMIGFKPSNYWMVMWGGITPLTLILVFGASIFFYESPKYGSYKYPSWAVIMGWVLGFFSLLPVPLVMVYKICRAKGPLLKRIKNLSKSTDIWGESAIAVDELSATYIKEKLSEMNKERDAVSKADSGYFHDFSDGSQNESIAFL